MSKLKVDLRMMVATVMMTTKKQKIQTQVQILIRILMQKTTNDRAHLIIHVIMVVILIQSIIHVNIVIRKNPNLRNEIVKIAVRSVHVPTNVRHQQSHLHRRQINGVLITNKHRIALTIPIRMVKSVQFSRYPLMVHTFRCMTK